MNAKYSPLRRTMRLAFQLLLLVGFVLLSVWAVAQPSPTLTSDQPDYAPGTTATFTGTGFQPGETVTVLVLHYDGTSDGGEDHQPWTVTADSTGSFVTTWHVCEDDCVNSTLRATADGASSGLHAEVIFTDAITRFPNGLSTTSSAQSICPSVAGSPITAVLATCDNGNGVVNHTNITYNWYYNTTNTNVISGSSVLVSSVNTTTATTASNFTPGPAPASIRYYFCQVTFSPAGNGNGCGGSGRPGYPYTTSAVQVTVSDTQNPSITAPANVNVTTNSGCTATSVSLGTPTTSDNCSVASVTNNHPSITYPLGTTTVTWTVTDGSGNTSTATQTVTVTDNVNPSITAPANVSVTTNSGCTATSVSLGTPTTSDNCSVASVTNNHPSTTYPLGTTTVTWTVTDGSGNTSTATQTVTVTDNVNPSITAPSNVSVTTNSGCTATGVSLGTPTTSDNCSVASVTNNHSSTTYPLGTTTVTWTVTDGSGNTATTTQTVTVTDNVNPTITAPTNVSVTTNSDCTATGVSLGTPTASDNCSIASVTNDHPSTTYPVGPTIVTWTVTDGSGNVAAATQTVTVSDIEAPSITTAANVSVNNASGQCSAEVSLTAPTTGDNCGVASVTNDHPSSTYPVGTTTVTWTVTDIHGNSNTATQTVTVTDNEAPSITAAANVSVNNASGQCSAEVSLTAPTISDNCGVASVTNDHPSSTYPVGTTTVTWTVTDIHGNSNTATQTVTVNDTEAPLITAPANVSVNNASGQCSAEVSLASPTTSDNCGVTSVTNDHSSSTYPVGTTTVTWTVTDIHGNSNTATQTVTVTDNEAPSITAAANVSVNNASGQCSAEVSLTAPTTGDNCGVASVTNDHPSSTYPVGTTTVTWTVTDIHGNSNTATQTVTVTDNEVPSITTAANVSVNNASGQCSAEVSLIAPTTSDNCGVASVTNDHPSSTYPVGTTTVTWTVTDIHGNSNTATQTVTVTDNEVPSITTAANVSVNNALGQCSAEVSLTAPTTGDNCGVASVTNDHPSSTYPVGTTTVTWTITDIHGNSNTATQTVTVTDNEVPSITTAANVSVNNVSSQCSAEVSLAAPTTSDNCGVASVTNDHLSSTYPVGTTTVTWTVTDIHGNSNTATQTVTVTDNEVPSITAAANVSVNNATGQCSAEVSLTAPTTSDNCGVASITNDHPSSTYPVGTTTVTWTVTDIHGNSNTATQTVTVTDNEVPSITASANVSVNNASGQCSAEVSLAAPTAGDNCGVASITNNHPSSTYPVGTTTVTWTVTDIHGNSNTATQTVTVNDVQAPAFTSISGNITLSACTATATWATPTADDNCSVTITQTAGPASGSVFANGSTTTIMYTATDGSGNSVSASFTVTRQATLTAAAVGTNVSCNGGSNGSASVTAGGGRAPYTYLWSNGATTLSISGLSAGTYSVVVRDADGCSANTSYIVTQPSALTTSATASAILCNGGSSTVTVTASGGAAPYSGTGTFTRSAGTWTFTVTDANGCTSTKSITISQPSALIAASTATAISCNGGTSTVTVSASGGTAPYSGTGSFIRTAGSWPFTVTDANGCSATTAITITQPSALTATISSSNSYLYFGYSGDQSATITATPSGGTAPYTISITMVNGDGSRIRNAGKLICDYITNSGDEVWTLGPNTQSTVSGCGVAPTSISKNNIAVGGSYSVSVTLLDDARFIATVTDANGCSYTIPYVNAARVDAEDVRCFAGNSTIQKVTMCHRTGSPKNPCVTICVDESAVNEHLAHGDFFGACNNTCTAPQANAKVSSEKGEASIDLGEFETYPNPFHATLSVHVTNPERAEVAMKMIDLTGRYMDVKVQADATENTYTLDTDKLSPGFYVLRVNIGNTVKVTKVMKE